MESIKKARKDHVFIANMAKEYKKSLSTIIRWLDHRHDLIPVGMLKHIKKIYF